MAQDKISFVLYCDIIHTVKKLSKEQAGELFLTILKYVNDENPVVDDFVVDLAFEPIKQSLKRELRKWKKTIKHRSESGRLGGLKSGEIRKAKNEANEASASTLKQNEANEAVLVPVPVLEPVLVPVKKKNMSEKSDLVRESFEIFRKSFPGTKRGLDIEFKNFIQKNKPEAVELLLPAIQKEITHKESLKLQGSFVAEWKNLRTWINQQCWTQEFPEIVPKINGKEVKYLTYKEMMAQCSPTCTSENFEIINTPEGKRWRLKYKP